MTMLTPKLGILIKRYERTVNILQLYNLAKLRKWTDWYTIQFFKVESPLSQPILASPFIWLTLRPLPPFKMIKMPTFSKNFWKQKSPPLYILGGGVGGGGHYGSSLMWVICGFTINLLKSAIETFKNFVKIQQRQRNSNRLPNHWNLTNFYEFLLRGTGEISPLGIHLA